MHQRDSVVVVGFVESDVVFCVDNEIAGIDVVTLSDHLEYFGLMDSTLLHEVNDLILYKNSMISVVIELYLNFVFKLTSLGQEVFFLYWVSEVFIVFS
jgi:hypothetical protein